MARMALLPTNAPADAGAAGDQEGRMMWWLEGTLIFFAAGLPSLALLFAAVRRQTHTVSNSCHNISQAK
jgi:hypothetical protein